jgi:pimeloyl-ACP methyl ester carboxylesterase
VPLSEHLPDDFRLVMMDFRGHGASDTPEDPFTFEDLVEDLEALLDRLDVQNPVLVGHSLGGMVAMAFVTENEWRTGGIVLFEGWVRVDAAPEDWDSGSQFLPEEERERVDERRQETQARMGPRKWLHLWQSVQQADAEEFLKRPPARIIAVWGDRGQAHPKYSELGFPPSMAAQHMWVEDQGHFMFLARPEVCAHPVIRLGRMAREQGDG